MVGGHNRNAFLLTCGFVLSVSGCQCGGDGNDLGHVQTELAVEPLAIDFGSVDLGSSAEARIHLTSKGAGRVTICFAGARSARECVNPTSLDPANAPFKIDLQDGGVWPLLLGGMATSDLIVRYAPSESGESRAILHVAYEESSVVIDVLLVGSGAPAVAQANAPLFELTPSVLDFGTMETGVTSLQSFRVKNISTVPLTLSAIRVESDEPSTFALATTIAIPQSLEPGNTVEVGVTYDARSDGRHQGMVIVESNASSGRVDLKAAVVGPEIEALPAVLAFGDVEVGLSGARTLLLTNTGSQPLTIDAIRFPGGELGLQIDRRLPTTLESGAMLQIGVVYSPRDTGQDAMELVILSDDTDESSLVVPVTGNGTEAPGCTLVARPNPVSFGIVARGDSTLVPIEVTNASDLDCSIASIVVRGAADMELAAGTTTTLPLPARASTIVEVVYTPQSADAQNGSLDIDYDAGRTLSVPLSAMSGASDLRAVPNPLDFGVVQLGCATPERTITLYNTSAWPVTLSSIVLDAGSSPAFELVPPPLPATIDAGASIDMRVRYRAATATRVTGLVRVTYAGSSELVIPLSGEASALTTGLERFTQAGTERVDVLFVVDTAASGCTDPIPLGSALATFIENADARSLDYHLGVIGTEIGNPSLEGRLYSPQGIDTPFVTPTTPARQEVFAANLNLLGEGVGAAAGLEAAYLALSSPLANGPNAGFLRADAALAIVFLSDEDDFSPRGIAFYNAFFRGLKGARADALFSAHAIVATNEEGCTADFGDAEFGARYLALVSSGNGARSICEPDYVGSLDTIGGAMFGLAREFTLTGTPTQDSIIVRVNGVSATNWTYDPATKTVTIPTAPANRSTIEIEYTTSSCT